MIGSITTLLGMILRNKTALENKHYQMQFDSAVAEIMGEMDQEYQTDYLARLQLKLEGISIAA